MTASHRRKRLGQHFLHDPRVIARIVSAIAPDRKTPIVEIGPGRGALTLPLLERAGALDVIEIDAALAAGLATRCAGKGTLRVHPGDALHFDFSSFGRPVKAVGNLPYSVSTPLLFHLLAQSGCILEMVFMLQREVVDRICAPPGAAGYGRLSVMVQARCGVQALFEVGRGAFSPPPRVDSAVIRLWPRDEFDRTLRDPVVFERVVRSAFAQRRKKLSNALKELLPQANTLLAELGIDPDARAEELSVEQFGRIANRLAAAPAAG